MNAPAASEVRNSLPRSADTAILRSIVGALLDPIFLFSLSNTNLAALNSAAADWVRLRFPERSEITLADLLPDLEIPTRLSAGDGSIGSPIMRTALVGPEDSRINVEVQLIALSDDEQTTPANSSDCALVIRGLRSSLQIDSGAAHDALNDAFHDPLTRLANRRLFERRLERAIKRAGKSNYHFAVLFVDLDRFKEINDRFGHIAGDQVLVAAAQRLVEAVRPQDMVARRDGDEFTILLDDLEQPEDAARVAERIVERLQPPLAIDGLLGAVSVGASIGIAGASDGGLSALDLIARADAAMYRAKALGGGTFTAFDDPIREPAEDGTHLLRKKLPR